MIDCMDVVRARYARGEITREEFLALENAHLRMALHAAGAAFASIKR